MALSCRRFETTYR